MSESAALREQARVLVQGAFNASRAGDQKAADEQREAAGQLYKMARELDRPVRMTKKLQGLIQRAEARAADWDRRAQALYEKSGMTKKVIQYWESRAYWLLRAKEFKARPRIT